MKEVMKIHKLLAICFIAIILTSTIPGLEENETQEIEEQVIEETKEVFEQVIKEEIIEAEETHTENDTNQSLQYLQGTNITEIIEEKEKEAPESEYIEIGNIGEVEEVTKPEEKSKDKTENDEKTETEEKREVKDEEEKPIKRVFYDQGKKVLEIEAVGNIPEITKSERIKNYGKEVIVSSEEHVTTPLIVYTDLETEANKEDIKKMKTHI
jgi:hypothetical protein